MPFSFRLGTAGCAYLPTKVRRSQESTTISSAGMKIAGFLLLVAGWLLVVCALVLLHPSLALVAFICAGLLIELFGLVLAVRSHMPLGEERG